MNAANRVKFDIILAIPGIPFNGDTFSSQSLGGSESAGYYMGRALAARGHRVTVFCSTEKPQRSKDVDYLPIEMFRSYVEYTPHDVCVVQRSPELLTNHVRSRFTAMWCHDLALGRSETAVKGVAWNYDKLFVLSEFMRSQYKATYSLPEELLHLTRNGVDLATVERAKAAMPADAARNPLSIVFAARPERGLEIMLGEIMPRILKVEPNAKLFLATYKNPVDHLAEFYTHCRSMAERLGSAVQYLGHLTKEQIYTTLLSAGVYAYPVPSMFAPDFDEISCLAVMEAQACGLPVVTSARGALPETLAPDAGVLIAEKVHTPEYYDAFAEAVLKFMRDPAAWRKASAAGLERAKSLDWAGVAEDWEALFEREIRANSADLATLANHFWRRSDIYAARACLERLPATDEKSYHVRERVYTDWLFLDKKDGFREQYERIGGTHDPKVIDWSPQEPRYKVLSQWLEKHAAEVKTALDYGCAHGGYATNLLKAHPDLRITGVDIDSHGIELAYSFAEKLGVSDRWRGVVGSFERLTDPDVPEMREMYDVAIAQEVLEHVPDPAAVLGALEARVKDGGYVYATVPFGPWEYTDYKRYPHRAHIWEFDLHDLHDMLDCKGKDAEVTISAMPYGHEPNTDEALGWWVIQYRVTAETRGKLGAIDMERKLWLQRPRQTVSATIIAGPNSEETLHWCLRSLEHVADEYIVADCGLSKEALRVLGSYDSRMRIIKGCDPKVEGFETPRNLAVEAATQDFILWIDTDEKMLQPERLHKYLRRNIFQGYSIRQHHFAVDTHFDADLPVRLFRNNGKLRFFGCVTGDTLIDTPAGQRPIKDLVGTTPWVYAYDVEKNHLVVTRPSEVALVKRNAEVLAVELDDGTVIRVTPEHPFLLRRHYEGTGEYRAAKDLKPGDSLMPMYRTYHRGYQSVRVSTKNYRPEHVFVHEQVQGKVPEGWHVHHKDKNPANNDPSNIVALEQAVHASLHNKGKVLSDETRERISLNHGACAGEDNSMFGRTHSDETKTLIGKKSRERGAGFGNSEKGWMTPERAAQLNKEAWSDPVRRAARIAAMKEGQRRRKALAADNHKVVSVTPAGREDVYNMEVPQFRNFIAGGVVVHNCIHEHPESAINEGPGRMIVLNDAHIAHVGYLIESGRQSRFNRNYPLLQMDIAKYPTRKLQKHFIMRDNMLMCTYELKQNGGKITASIRQRCLETIEIYREHFLGKGHFTNSDPLQYYSQAVGLMASTTGEGIDFAFQIQADKMDASQKINGATSARFANLADAEAEILHRVREAAEPFNRSYY